MAKTSFATNNALTKKTWEEDLYEDINIECITDSWCSEGKNSFIQVRNNLTKSKGDAITFGIRSNLTGDGVTSGQILEGNEEKLQTYDYTITLEQYRNAVRDDGAMSRQRAMFSIDNESRDAIRDWGAQKIDTLRINALLASPTKTLYRDGVAGAFSGTATPSTAKTALTAANSKLTPNFMSALRVWAMTGGNGSSYRLRPVVVNGQKVYGLVVNPACLFDLKTDAIWQQAMREAMDKGKNNPLFKDAVAIWDNVIVYESEKITLFTDGGGASVVGCYAILMGAQAGVWAWGQRGEVVQETFDYKNENAYAYEMICRAGKPKFNSKDYAVVGVALAATNVTGV